MLERVLRALEPEGAAQLERGDPRFERLANLMLDGQYKEATSRAQELIEGGCNDVRVLCYYLFGVFVQGGVTVLPEVLGATALLVTESWERLSPRDRRELHAMKSVGWLLTEVASRLQRVEAEGGETWEAWIGSASQDTVEAALERIGPLREGLLRLEPDDEKPIHTNLYSVEIWLRSFGDGLGEGDSGDSLALEAPPPQRAPEPAVQPVVKGKGAAPGGNAEAPVTGSEGLANQDEAQGPSCVPESPALRALILKLEACETLLTRGDYERAAIVFSDINTEMEAFDPRRYLPSLFGPLYLAVQGCTEELEQAIEGRDSFRWQALEQLYRVDLSSFVAEREDD